MTNIFSVSKQPDPMLERAESLVSAAQINAVSMFTTMGDHYPILKKVDLEHWDYILTVAGVFIATSCLSKSLGKKREEKLLSVIAERLNQWQSGGICGFENCKEMFDGIYDSLVKDGHEPRFLASDAVGSWIVLNILGRHPQAEEEFRLIRVFGVMVVHSFFNWWDK